MLEPQNTPQCDFCGAEFSNDVTLFSAANNGPCICSGCVETLHNHVKRVEYVEKTLLRNMPVQ